MPFHWRMSFAYIHKPFENSFISYFSITPSLILIQYVKVLWGISYHSSCAMAKPFLQKQTNKPVKQFRHDKCDSNIHIRIICHSIKIFVFGFVYYKVKSVTVSHQLVDDYTQWRIYANYYFNWIFSWFISYVISFLQVYLTT